MPVDVKFCGLTRAEDAACAASLGAAYVGVIFADSPRRVAPAEAAAVLAPTRGRVTAVGVFGPESPREIAAVATDVGLDVVQLHGDVSPEFVTDLRRCFGGAIWAVARIAGAAAPASVGALFRVADALVLDTLVSGRLGGSGVSFDWEAVARGVAPYRTGGRLVLAGGLHEGNVARAVRLMAPDVVDVSSGVERAPGIKDHARMQAFAAAALGGGGGNGRE